MHENQWLSSPDHMFESKQFSVEIEKNDCNANAADATADAGNESNLIYIPKSKIHFDL